MENIYLKDVPILSQHQILDPRTNGTTYISNCCGETCIAMCLQTPPQQLNVSNEEIVNYALKNQYFDPEDPLEFYTTHLISGQIAPTKSKYDCINCIRKFLQLGYPIIVDVRARFKTSSATHFVVVRGIREEGEKVEIAINDPYFTAIRQLDGSLIWEQEAGTYFLTFEEFDASWNSHPG
eukprot:TRINITY_DN476_c3_g1_i2.p1 TRINITY_DN476_c3_g1~~TRINITY_DN476_c3_g1_i2.p1  ORF type:complete len:180 (-),score=77.26 TRINITY_DN476_c3_g1_i2:141-680(-)